MRPKLYVKEVRWCGLVSRFLKIGKGVRNNNLNKRTSPSSHRVTNKQYNIRPCEIILRVGACMLVRSQTNTMNFTAKFLFSIALLVLNANAYCPNGCSGHGSCGINGTLLFLWKTFAFQRRSCRVSPVARFAQHFLFVCPFPVTKRQMHLLSKSQWRCGMDWT